MSSEDTASTQFSYRRFINTTLAILGSAFLLCWPAFWNRFPLLFPDEGRYLWDGRILRGHYLAPFVDIRSEIYCVAVYVLYPRFGVWAAVALQALLASWVLWLVVRSVVRKRQVAVFLVLAAGLSVLTGASWYVSFLMPDILGPLLYLNLYLPVFASETLRSWEKCVLLVVCLFAVTAHPTHLVLAVSECLVLGVFWLFGWFAMRQRGVWLLRISAVVLLAMGAQVALHAFLYGVPSVFGIAPPALTARLLGDGPARTYLHGHCDGKDWLLCNYVNHLPETEEQFLWLPGSIWQTATPAQRQEIRREELPLLRAVLSTYPREQLQRSWSNFLEMLGNVGIQSEFYRYPVPLIVPHDKMLMQVNGGYLQSRQLQGALPLTVFRGLYRGVLVVALGFLFLLLPLAWRRRQDLSCQRLLGLAAVVLFVLPANAFLCGVFSGNDPRYQGRVAWLLVLLAALLAVVTLQEALRVVARASEVPRT